MMANSFYDGFKNDLLTGQIDFSSDTIKAALIADTYTFAAGSNAFSTISSHSVAEADVTGISVTGGGISCSQIDFGAVDSAGATVNAIVFYNASHSDQAFLYIDTGIGGLPGALNADVTVSPSGSGVFVL